MEVLSRAAHYRVFSMYLEQAWQESRFARHGRPVTGIGKQYALFGRKSLRQNRNVGYRTGQRSDPRRVYQR